MNPLFVWVISLWACLQYFVQTIYSERSPSIKIVVGIHNAKNGGNPCCRGAGIGGTIDVTSTPQRSSVRQTGVKLMSKALDRRETLKRLGAGLMMGVGGLLAGSVSAASSSSPQSRHFRSVQVKGVVEERMLTDALNQECINEDCVNGPCTNDSCTNGPCTNDPCA